MTKNIFSEFFDHESEFCLKKDLVIIDDKVLDGLCTVIRVQKQKRFSWKDQSQQHDVDQYFKFFFFLQNVTIPSQRRVQLIFSFFLLLKIVYFLTKYIRIMILPPSTPPISSSPHLPSGSTPFFSLIRKEHV